MNIYFTPKKIKGFTLLEVVVVVALVVIIATTSFTIQGSILVDTNVDTKTREVVEMLKLAQLRSISRYKDSQWGVYFQVNPGDDRFIVYKGSSYATRNTAYDMILNLSTNLSFSNITFSGSEVNFAKITGKTTQTGSVQIVPTQGNTVTISVNSLWVIDVT